jgi:hypothetical protein
MSHEQGDGPTQAKREVQQLRASVRWARRVLEHPEAVAAEYDLDARELQELFGMVHDELVRSHFAISRTLLGPRWAVEVDERAVVVRGVLPPVLRAAESSTLYMRGPIPPFINDDDDQDDDGDREED